MLLHKRLVAMAWIAVAMAACGSARTAAQPLPSQLSCIGRPGLLTWIDLSEKSSRGDLDTWCQSVGAPVIDLTPANSSGQVQRLLVLSWNVHVGAGRVTDVVDMLRPEPRIRLRQGYGGQGRGDTEALFGEKSDDGMGDVGIVLLLQEVFRTGEEIPESFPRLLRVPGRIAPTRASAEVGRLARDLGMSVAYVPSMRNGSAALPAEREDRGSAILSTESLSEVTAIELPMLKQRRVVVMATLTPRGSPERALRVMTTHFDTLGPRGAQARALAAYVAALPRQPALIMGGDLNALWGARDQTVRTMSGVMGMEPCGTRRTHLFGRFDYIFSTLGSEPARTCETLDDKYSSDHRPLLLRLTL